MMPMPAIRIAAAIRTAACVSLCVLGAASGRGQRQAGPDSTLQAIQSMYDAGLYGNAELEARRYLERPMLSDSSRIVAEQLIAFSLVAQGRPAVAADHFAAILTMDSTYALDPVLTSPKILQAFESAHQQSHLVQTRTKDDDMRSAPPPSPPPSFRLLLFPGWDQLHRGRTTKGYVLLSAGALSAVSAITFDILRRAARDDYLSAGSREDAVSTYETYDRYAKAEYYSIVVFGLVYLYSAFDAVLDLPPQLEAGVIDTPSGVALKARWTF